MNDRISHLSELLQTPCKQGSSTAAIITQATSVRFYFQIWARNFPFLKWELQILQNWKQICGNRFDTNATDLAQNLMD